MRESTKNIITAAVLMAGCAVGAWGVATITKWYNAEKEKARQVNECIAAQHGNDPNYTPMAIKEACKW